MQICEREDIATNISAWVYRQSGRVWKKLGKMKPAACGRVFTCSIFGEGVHFLPIPPLCSLLFVPCVANPCCYCPTLAGLGQHWGGLKPFFAPVVNFLRPGSTIVHSMSKDKGTVSQVRRHPQDKEAVRDGEDCTGRSTCSVRCCQNMYFLSTNLFWRKALRRRL